MQDFHGIAEKLVRAEENIRNLDSEIERFFNESDYPVFPEHNRELHLKAIQYHKNLSIPLRFSVLAGEANHQLRACFDHIVWHFSIGATNKDKWIEFPVFTEQPIDEKNLARFNRKIERITDPDTRDLIERLQPYNAADPLDHPLWVIHDFDIIDKHKQLLICPSTPSKVFSIETGRAFESYQRAHPELNHAQLARQFESNGSDQPCISFRNFGRREIEPVTQGLLKLFNYTVGAVKQFEVL